ncbi:hypothetical protein [Parabacteroides pacaensis]|uniref:hypothetical protein n=1 Tax=Parabacteroides pacaensis TaxID=2086575 RepID=UPI00131E172B|nr:hypothetical protein [Parabacteroides pacaensis]
MEGEKKSEVEEPILRKSPQVSTLFQGVSLILGSHKDVETSAVYPIFIAICRMRVLSFCEFLKAYFSIAVDGRTDYENLMSALLG